MPRPESMDPRVRGGDGSNVECGTLVPRPVMLVAAGDGPATNFANFTNGLPSAP